jgi:DDE superfamily endonuclease
VFLAYASRFGHALIDRDLYVPQSWTDDRERCRTAGIPEEAEFTTKPRQAQAMIARAVAAGVPFAWFTADETYGQAKWLQAWLEDQDIWYVMAIRCSDTLTMPAGERRADDLIAAVPARSWQKISAGAGAHGPRKYHWARIPVRTGWKRGRGHWLLARPHHLVHARAGLARCQPPADRPDPAVRPRSQEGLVLVPLAPATPVPGPAVPLPAARLCTHLSAPVAASSLNRLRQPCVPAVAAN